jgi:hypothetical protein
MKFGFLVTSAINTKFGVYSADERLNQTIATILSIRARCANAHITLIEMAGLPLQQSQRNILNQHINVLVDFTTTPEVQEIYKSDNWDIVKSATEMMCFQAVLDLAKTNLEYADIDRFVKVSGRYTLTTDFDILDYVDLQDKIVFAKRKLSQFPPAVTGGVTQQYMSRCWSFPAAMLDEISKQYIAMRLCMYDIVNKGGYIDIEHLLFLYTDAAKIHEVEAIGVQGLLGPNGILVKD